MERIEINPRLVRKAETESQAENDYEDEKSKAAEEELLAAAAKARTAMREETVGECALSCCNVFARSFFAEGN